MHVLAREVGALRAAGDLDGAGAVALEGVQRLWAALASRAAELPPARPAAWALSASLLLLEELAPPPGPAPPVGWQGSANGLVVVARRWWVPRRLTPPDCPRHRADALCRRRGPRLLEGAAAGRVAHRAPPRMADAPLRPPPLAGCLEGRSR